MRALKQRFKHNPEGGVWGDCHRASIATVLGLDLDDVPHFADGGCSGEEFARREREFLASRGIASISLPVSLAESSSYGDLLAMVAQQNGDDFVYLLGGTSRTGVNHTVVCRGSQIFNDPSLTDAGIIGPCADGYFWLTFFGALAVCAQTPSN